MRNRPWLQMGMIGLIGVAILLPIALVVPWFPESASTQAGKVDELFNVLLIVSVPVFVLVETVVIYCVWKFRMRPGEELRDGPPLHGSTRLEVIWTAAPAILIIALVTYAYTVLQSNEKTLPGTRTVDVIGEQFAWYFSYPQGRGQAVVSQQLILPKDAPVVFHIHSRDVIHAFWVPAFRVQLDAVPGITSTVRATPTRTGNYPLVCAELCGNGHALMRAPVRVLPAAAFNSWLARQPRQAAPSDSYSPAGASGSSAPNPNSTPAGGGPASGAQTAPSGSNPTASAPPRRMSDNSLRSSTSPA